MAASSRLMIAEAERRFAVRIKIAVPAGGFGAVILTASTQATQRKKKYKNRNTGKLAVGQ